MICFLVSIVFWWPKLIFAARGQLDFTMVADVPKVFDPHTRLWKIFFSWLWLLW
jgi:hypothetical protein